MGGSGSTLRGNNRTYSNISDIEATLLRAKAYGTDSVTAREIAEDALRTYEGNHNSHRINEALRKETTDKLPGYLKDTITNMDNSMRPIGKDINVIRNLDTSYMREVLGINLNGNIPKQVSTANSKLKGVIKQEKGFMSTSYNPALNVFTQRPVQMRIQVPSNAKGIFGTVYGESEIVLARNTKYVIRGISFDGRKIYVDATILP